MCIEIYIPQFTNKISNKQIEIIDSSHIENRFKIKKMDLFLVKVQDFIGIET